MIALPNQQPTTQQERSVQQPIAQFIGRVPKRGEELREIEEEIRAQMRAQGLTFDYAFQVDWATQTITLCPWYDSQEDDDDEDRW